MCNIAGYTGNRQAAPILIEMLRREQFFDGGLSTGIATIHEGKLYTAKVTGDVDELLRQTDAINFPGTCGIIHSRPAGKHLIHAHPFLDESGECAIVLNGTSRGIDVPEFYEESNRIMQRYFDRGSVKTTYSPPKAKKRILNNGLCYHDSEVYALMIGEYLQKNGATQENAVEAMREAISTLPADIVVLSVHARLPGLITVGDISRPMCVASVGEETYLATTAFAFPDEISDENITQIPPASVSYVTPGKAVITGKVLDGVKVEQPSARAFALAYTRIENILKGQKDSPKSISDFPLYREWRDIWNRPFVECKYAKEGDLLKPTASVTYQVLWSMHKEGRLHRCLSERDGMRVESFWLD